MKGFREIKTKTFDRRFFPEYCKQVSTNCVFVRVSIVNKMRKALLDVEPVGCCRVDRP